MTAGSLAVNVVHFARLLRRAGLPIGAGEAVAGARALAMVDIGDRQQAQAALRAVMVHRREHQEVFDQAFALFWRDPTAAMQAAALALMSDKAPREQRKAAPGQRRVAEAMASPRATRSTEEKPPEHDAVMTVSEREQLQTMDFEQMSAAQIANAKAEIRRLRLPLDLRRTRRLRRDPRGPRIDMGGTLRRSLRRGGEIVELSRARRVVRPPPLVVLCDISGSMARYAQVMLHFLHAVANDRDRVHVFLFGTRLSNITRQLKNRDPEVAFQMVAHAVPDWSGGTRIG
ncbi:MAG TPA: VWA domain-containing protein, partial [Acetobacteraceae bacterium]|nr:VWA domain-containing protein [Acetobacteraceae bacterium]